MSYTQIKITSYTGQVYAEAGVFVTLVADHGNVHIVTNGGQAFPVRVECLGEEVPEVVSNKSEKKQDQLSLF